MRFIKDNIIKSEENDIEQFTNEVDNSHLIYYMVMRRFEFDLTYIEKHRNQMEKKFKKSKKPNKKRNEKYILCDSEHPICIYDKEEEADNYCILKVHYKPVIIDNFYSEDGRKPETIYEDSNDVYKDLLIERRVHYCKMDHKRIINNSFTASHPIFSDIISYDNKRKNTIALCI